MYRIGIKQGKWLIITDGYEVYQATEDVRYYSKTPNTGTNKNGKRYTEKVSEENRVTRLNISQGNFENHCQAQGLEVRSCTTSGEKAKKMSGPAVFGGVFGAVVGGPVGAAIGAGISGWFASGSDFNIDDISSAFKRAKEHSKEWDLYDIKLTSVDREQEKRYIQKAQEEWRRFHKLKNLSSLDELNGYEFESAIAGLYEHKGYTVEITKASGDYGVDVLAKKGQELLAIQAKRYSGKVGIKAVQEVSSGAFYYKATKALVVTNSFYTNQAKELAKITGITLINKKHLANMWESYQPNNVIPPFNIQEYERVKKEIKRELYRIDVSAGKKHTKQYMR